MIRFERSRQFRRHMKSEAVKYAKEASALAGKIDGSAHFEVFTGFFGSVDRVFWVAEFEGLAALDKVLMKIEADAGWKQFNDKAPKDLFVDGSGRESNYAVCALTTADLYQAVQKRQFSLLLF